jgi:hypothetical protein
LNPGHDTDILIIFGLVFLHFFKQTLEMESRPGHDRSLSNPVLISQEAAGCTVCGVIRESAFMQAVIVTSVRFTSAVATLIVVVENL